ncbi:MAG: Calx-beta domain-containing protein, partial [Planctomycetota bacterium]
MTVRKLVLTLFVLFLPDLVRDCLATTWTGAVSSAWSNNSNWSASEPSTGDDADIPVVSNAPVITQAGEVAYRVYVNGPMWVDGGTLTVGERIVVGSSGVGTLTNNGGIITVTGNRLAMGDGANGTLNMNDGLIDVQGSSGIKNPDGTDTTVINLNGGTIQCTYLEAKAYGSLIFNASAGYPHGGLLIADGDHTQTSGGGYTHTFIGQMILDGWITTTIPGDIVICEYDTPAYPGKTVVMSVFNPVVVQFDSSSSGALESVSPAEISVSLSFAADHNVTVDYNVTGGTAEGAGVDYTLLGSGTLTFDPCQTTETISISIVNDGEDEENETIILTLSDPNGAEIGDINEHTYTIIDPRPDVQFDSPGRASWEDNISVTIPVSLSHTWSETVTVEYEVTGGTATGGGADYLLADGTLIFDPCEITHDINFTIVDDACQEGEETIELLLSEPNNAKLGDYAQLTFTIIDDDAGSTYTNSLGMEFTTITPGTFQMGSDGGEWDERPVHNVTISEQFLAQVMEITSDQYGQFDANYSGSDAATGMSWHDANAFAEWLSQREGITYRLPTEAEWEYICRAGTTTSYSSGVSPPPPDTPNPWGVKDMHNSPREWVRDWHGEYSYEDQVDPVGPEQGLARVVRGGGLDDNGSYYFRSANRAGIGPGFGGGQHDIGFRLVLGELPATAPERYAAPFVRQGIKQNTTVVLQAPNPSDPYFNQRPLLPIPPDNASREVIDAAGLHPSFRGHNHSPGLEVCPNGDVLMIIYTSYSEYEPGVSLMATRLRFGALVWDIPTPIFDFLGANDHAPMLWNDNGTLHFFWGCPRLEPENSNPYPFQWISSTDS